MTESLNKNAHLSAWSYAKLNLTLEILGKRQPDGYHQVRTLMQSIDLADEIDFHLVFDQPNQISINTGKQCLPLFPKDDTNLIAKAYWLFLSKLQKTCSLTVTIKKEIPIASGLAGGSSNAAATLLALNEGFGKPLEHEQLLSLAASLGSDVPFFLTGGTAIAVGRGTRLQPVDSHLPLWFVVVKPRHLTISTSWLYQEFDENSLSPASNANTQNAVLGLLNNNQELALASFGNEFQQLAFNRYPELAELKDLLLHSGCLKSQMTGSGPAVFGIVEGGEMARMLVQKVLEQSTGIDCFIARSINQGTKIVMRKED